MAQVPRRDLKQLMRAGAPHDPLAVPDAQAPPSPPKTPAKVTGKRKAFTVTDNVPKKASKANSESNKTAPKKASKVNSGSKQMAKTTVSKGSRGSRRSSPTKRSGKKYGRSRKSRRGKKMNKASRSLMKKRMEMPGPIGRIHCYLPTIGTDPMNPLTDYDYFAYDVNLADSKASGYVNSTPMVSNWIGYSILTKKQVFRVSQAGELASAGSYAPTSWKGIFDPAPVGVETALGASTGSGKNYVKTTETFIFDKCNLEIFLSNCNNTPCRVWVDIWKCKDDVQCAQSSPFTFAGPMYDVQTAYNEQAYYQGIGAHPAKTLKQLFQIPEFRPLKVSGRNNWSHQQRYVKYMVPGDETKVTHKLSNLVYNGQKVEAREASQVPTVEYTYIQNVSHYVTICVLGLVGKSGDTGNPSNYARGEVSTQIKMDIVAHRANIFTRSPKQYIIDTPMPLPAVTEEPKVVELTRTTYPLPP